MIDHCKQNTFYYLSALIFKLFLKLNPYIRYLNWSLHDDASKNASFIFNMLKSKRDMICFIVPAPKINYVFIICFNFVVWSQMYGSEKWMYSLASCNQHVQLISTVNYFRIFFLSFPFIFFYDSTSLHEIMEGKMSCVLIVLFLPMWFFFSNFVSQWIKH